MCYYLKVAFIVIEEILIMPSTDSLVPYLNPFTLFWIVYHLLTDLIRKFIFRRDGQFSEEHYESGADDHDAVDSMSEYENLTETEIFELEVKTDTFLLCIVPKLAQGPKFFWD